MGWGDSLPCLLTPPWTGAVLVTWTAPAHCSPARLPQPPCPAARPDRSGTSDGAQHRDALGLRLRHVKHPSWNRSASQHLALREPRSRSSGPRTLSCQGGRQFHRGGKADLARKRRGRLVLRWSATGFQPKLARSRPTLARDVGRILALGTCPDRARTPAFCRFLAVASGLR